MVDVPMVLTLAETCICGGTQRIQTHRPGGGDTTVIPCPHCTDATQLYQLLETSK